MNIAIRSILGFCVRSLNFCFWHWKECFYEIESSPSSSGILFTLLVLRMPLFSLPHNIHNLSIASLHGTDLPSWSNNALSRGDKNLNMKYIIGPEQYMTMNFNVSPCSVYQGIYL